MKYNSIASTLEDNGRMDIIAKSSCVMPNNHLHNVIQKYGGHTAVEIGTYKGLSAVAMSSSFKWIHTFDVLYQPDAVDVFKMFGCSDYIKYKYKSSLVDPTIMTDKDYQEYSWLYGSQIREEISQLEFQFAFIDGCHVYEEAKKDFEAVKKCGVVLFHDYRKSFPEIIKFCDEIGCEPLGEFALWQK